MVDDTTGEPLEPQQGGTGALQPDIQAGEHPEVVNLAFFIPKAELDTLALEVIEDYETDLQSRSEWDELHKIWTELYYQTDYASTSEAGDDRMWGATESLPILTEAANQFAARGRKTFFPNRDFVGAIVSSLGKDPQVANDNQPGGGQGGIFDKLKNMMAQWTGSGTPHDDDTKHLETLQEKLEELRERAERVAKHMNFQLNTEVMNYRENKVALFLSTAVHGMMFTKVYPDYSTGKYVPKIENVRGVDLIVPYMAGPTALEDLPRKTHKLFPTVLETEMMARSKFFTSRCKAAQDLQGKQSGQDMAAQKADGLTQGADNDEHSMARQAFVLECHRFWEIPDPADKTNKIIAPVIVWVDYEAREVKRLAIRYETDEQGNPIEDRKPVEYLPLTGTSPTRTVFMAMGWGRWWAN